MPSVFSHAAFSWALGSAAPELPARRRVLWAAAFCSVVADLDSVGLFFGVPYASRWGHRGIMHSLAFAATLGIATAWVGFRRELDRTQRWIMAGVLAVAAATHPLLDMLTDGGLGVALFAPFDWSRIFFPWRPIAVSPIGAGFFSARGLAVFESELVWVWAPGAAIATAGWAARRAMKRRTADDANEDGLPRIEEAE